MIKLLPVTILSLAMLGCANQGPNEQSGMVIGGILGGVIGHQVGHGRGNTMATVIGTIAGAAIGSSIGQKMDELDRMKMNASLETVRTGVKSEWKNPDTNYEYAVTPTRTYETAQGPCREYTLDASIGGKTEQIYGRACRQADGSWKIVE
jgi:surface antigen